MKTDVPCFRDPMPVKRYRRSGRSAMALRYAILIAAGGVVSGCAHDAVLGDPRTGATVTCRQNLGGLDPWSQAEGCAADHVAQGWTTSGSE